MENPTATPETSPAQAAPPRISQCCAIAYESDVAQLLLGASFHPGGEQTTRRLGELMGLKAGSRVLDVACGRGESALTLARTFGVRATGLDLSAKNVAAAREAAAAQGLADQLEFIEGDASTLTFADASFDALVCECAFCLFPDKTTAAREFARVLKPGGILGISDLTRDAKLPPDLEGLLAWVACIADAQPVEVYQKLLATAGFNLRAVESADDALRDLVRQIRLRLLSAQALIGLKRLTLPGFDFEAAQRFSKAALAAVDRGQLGYALLTAIR